MWSGCSGPRGNGTFWYLVSNLILGVVQKGILLEMSNEEAVNVHFNLKVKHEMKEEITITSNSKLSTRCSHDYLL